MYNKYGIIPYGVKDEEEIKILKLLKSPFFSVKHFHNGIFDSIFYAFLYYKIEEMIDKLNEKKKKQLKKSILFLIGLIYYIR